MVRVLILKEEKEIKKREDREFQRLSTTAHNRHTGTNKYKYSCLLSLHYGS